MRSAAELKGFKASNVLLCLQVERHGEECPKDVKHGSAVAPLVVADLATPVKLLGRRFGNLRSQPLGAGSATSTRSLQGTGAVTSINASGTDSVTSADQNATGRPSAL